MKGVFGKVYRMPPSPTFAEFSPTPYEDAKGATGRPVPLLAEFLLGRADDDAD
jgi:hypothetical protein